MALKAAIVPLVVLLASCSESGTEGDGPFKAHLVLQGSNGAVRDFSLGGYESLSKCISLLAFEVESYEQDQNQKFYTNPEFTYGGYETAELSVEHLIIGAKCVGEHSTAGP